MPLSSHGSKLLQSITASPPKQPWNQRALLAAQVDVSSIPADILDDVVDEMGGLLVFHRTLRLNQAVLEGCNTKEVKAAERLLEQVKQGILDGKVTLGRGPQGHVVTMAGVPSAASSVPVPKSSSGEYQVKVKSLKSWGITYGYRVWMNHALIEDLAAGGQLAAAIIAWLPVAGWISTIIAAVAAVLKALDTGKGIYFYVTFAGIWWAKPA